ncbi:type I restriction-modification system subunit M, partial [Mycoplasma bovis]|nr:type I restriction-modification system subunit M [Mycoplasmopsis bovis]
YIDKKGEKFLKFFKNFVKSVEEIEHVDLVQLESVLSDYIFENMNSIPLVDAYDIYQIFVNNLDVIKDDIELISKYYQDYDDKSIVLQEILKGEIKKNTGEGSKNPLRKYKTDIFDIEWLQEKFFSDRYWQAKDKDEEIKSLNSELKELEKSIDEEDKSDEIYNFKENKWKCNNIKKIYNNVAKEINSLDSDSLEYKLTNICMLNWKIETTKSDAKSLANFLVEESYKKYMSLNSNEFYELLIEKWIVPIIEQINKAGISVVDDFVSKIETLSEKYSDTFEDINNQIVSNERELISLLKDLKGEENDMKAIDELIKIIGGK